MSKDKIEVLREGIRAGADRIRSVNSNITFDELMKHGHVEERKTYTMISQYLQDSKGKYLKDSNGNELFKPIGSNVTTIMGTQNIIVNSHEGVTPVSKVDYFENEPGLNVAPVTSWTSNTYKIFAFALATDGGEAQAVYPVLRHIKGYNDLDDVPAFQVVKLAEDDPVTYLQTYVLRHVDTVNNDVYYYLKRLVPSFKNITTDGNALPTKPNNYTGTLDVRSVITYDILIDSEELFKWFGIIYGNTEKTFFNSIMLFAGRPCTIQIGSSTINTYREIFCTNKLNFSNKQMRDVELKFRYELYYV